MDQKPEEPEKTAGSGDDKPSTMIPKRRSRDSGKPVKGLEMGFQIGGKSTNPRKNPPPQEVDREQVIRLEQESPRSPVIPKQIIPEIEKTEVASRRHTRGEGAEWGTSKSQSIRWIIGTGVLVVILVIVAVSLQPNLSRSGSHAARETPMVVPLEPARQEEDAAEPVFGGFDLTGASEIEALALLTKYAAATSVEEVLPLIRGDKAMESTLREHWKSWGANASWQPRSDGGFSVSDTGTFSYATIQGLRPDFSPFTAYFLIENDRLVIDWAATEAHGDMDFQQLQAGEAAGGIVRVWIEETDYFTLALPEASFRAFRLTSPDMEDAVWGYIRRGGAIEENIDRYFRSGGILNAPAGIQKATLVLEKAHEGTLPNQWMIREMLHNDWATP